MSDKSTSSQASNFSSAKQYPFADIEPKWQKFWLDNKTFKAEDFSKKPKYYILDMFPYPSGAGLHVGHPEGYTATDIVARFKRMNGFNVLHPMGWDAFGLPAEQYAIQTGTHPRETTQKNIKNFRKQIQRLGFSYDWDREVDTTDPNYYKWTQWIFLQLYKKGLAYEEEIPVNWCPELKTVLANEEVVDGKSERGGHPVERRPMRQWMLKITEYADRLLEDLDDLDWPESLKEMQRNWIGKSVGANVHFKVKDGGQDITVFTTRPDTLFGATYMVLAPEHPLVSKITTSDQKESVKKYQAAAQNKSDLDRTELSKEKTGIFTGAHAINPVNGQSIPIWIADYVMMTYGTGAIMAVPAHDMRDHEFAIKFKLPIIEVVQGGEDVQKEAYVGEGVLVNSDLINGLAVPEATQKITTWLEKKKLGEPCVQYKLRDWIFSRQRYWGEPFPLIIKEDGSTDAVSEKDLPVTLPEMDRFEPNADGDPPLSNAQDWVKTKDSKGNPASRETNTMPQWAGSCWYYLRYIDPQNSEKAWDPKKEKYWMNVDLYVGGVEHAVLHLLYARFWHKVLYDLGHVSTKEPFQKLINQGLILGNDGEKMSKSRGNVVSPDEIIDKYGADAMRLYEMFMGPLSQVKPWKTDGLEGTYRFCQRIWRLIVAEGGGLEKNITDIEISPELNQLLHQTIKEVTEDTESLSMNTAIAKLMTLLNEFYKLKEVPKEAVETFILLVSPYTPHLAEELWERLGHSEPLAYHPWPKFDAKVAIKASVNIAIQVNGKIKVRFDVPSDLSKSDLEKCALDHDEVKDLLDGKSPKKVIAVPGRLVNIIL